MTFDQAYVDTICRKGRGADCCRYIGMGPDGWRCLKLTLMRTYLDKRVATGTMNAKGDNCPGQPDDARAPIAGVTNSTIFGTDHGRRGV